MKTTNIDIYVINITIQSFKSKYKIIVKYTMLGVYHISCK